MGIDCFVYAAYGVLMDSTNDSFARFEELFAEQLGQEQLALISPNRPDEDEPDTEELHDPEFIADRVFEEYPTLLTEICESCAAPKDADLLWTGNDDKRPGRCDAESERWILGYGISDFPLDHRLPAAFIKQSKWHTWVES
jgi:hypothetical protein